VIKAVESSPQSEMLSLEITETILHCCRHLFFPSSVPMSGADVELAHCEIEVRHARRLPARPVLDSDTLVR
jgi:hypothetical protein